MAYPAVTTQRVENAFKRLHLPTERDDDGDVVVNFDTKVVYGIVEDDNLTLQAVVRTFIEDPEEIGKLWHQSMAANMGIPMGKVVIDGDFINGSTVQYRYHYPCRTGLSDEQLVALIDEFLRVFNQMFES